MQIPFKTIKFLIGSSCVALMGALSASAGYTYVAAENATVNFSTPVDVSYGANSSFAYIYGVAGNITFNNATFTDPDPGVVKSGYFNAFAQCASENGSYNFTVPVEAAYGANGAYAYKEAVSGTVFFNNGVWGDPSPGVAKAGYYMPYTQCATEGQSYTFSSPTDVAFGANGQYFFMYAVTGTITFNDATFGDPNTGVSKAGYFRPRNSGWGVTWSDQFAGVNNYPNSLNWGYDLGGGGWGNNELETYVNSWANAHIISDGTGTDGQALQIEAQTDSNTWSGNWYSARITTYGHHLVPVNSYVEYRCKFPNAGQGYWPAGWMLGTVGGTWPACGEIDVAEEVNGQWENHQSLHMPGWDPTVVTSPNSSTTTYHNYGAWWTPTSITFSTDGVNTATFSQGGGGTWEFNSNNQFFILLNLAIGGNFPGNPNSGTQVNGNFDIDYVEQYNN